MLPGAALLNLMRPQEALESINASLDTGSGKEYLVYYNRAAAQRGSWAWATMTKHSTNLMQP